MGEGGWVGGEGGLVVGGGRGRACLGLTAAPCGGSGAAALHVAAKKLSRHTAQQSESQPAVHCLLTTTTTSPALPCPACHPSILSAPAGSALPG